MPVARRAEVWMRPNENGKLSPHEHLNGKGSFRGVRAGGRPVGRLL